MAYLKLDYSQIDKAARRAGETADRLRSYADAINRHIANPTSSVAGGQNGNTSAVVSLASQKANKLIKKASDYDSIRAKLEKLAKDAETADSAVAQKMKSDQKAQEANLQWYEKLAVDLHNFVNGFCGESEVGRFLNSMREGFRLLEGYKRDAIKAVTDWFTHGNGKYVLNIVITVAAAVAAVAAIITTGGLIAIIAAVVAVGAAYFTVKDNLTALSTSGDNPGYARHMGSTDSWGSYASKHYFDKTTQTVFSVVDVVGTLASIATTAKGMFKTTNQNGDVVFDYTKETFKKNMCNQVGLSRKDAYVRNGYVIDQKGFDAVQKGIKSGTMFEKTIKGTEYIYEPGKILQTIHGYKNVSSAKNVASGVETAAKNVKRGASDIKSLCKLLNGKSNGQSITKYVLKRTPLVKDWASIGYDTADLFEDVGKVFNAYA